MRRGVLIGLIAAIGALGLGLAPGALAAQTGSLTWAQPGSFTATAPGANPDHDPYGGTPWSYAEAASATSFSPLGTFATGLTGGASGWQDGAGTVIGVNPSTPTQLVMAPASGEQAALVWASPLAAAASIAVSGSVTPATNGVGCALSGYSWSLVRAGQVLAAGSNSTATIPTTAVIVPPGGTVALLIAPTGLYNAGCATAEVTLGLATAATAPAVSLSSPTAGSVYVSPAQPSFAGTAGTAYGDSAQVSIQIYSGTSATGTPVQTVSSTAAGGQFSVASPPLGSGTYTAVAQQSDLATPADTASSTVSFTVTATGTGSGSGTGASGSFVLTQPATEPFTAASPTLDGTAPVANAGDAIALNVYAGAGASGTPVRQLSGTVNPDGSFSFTVAPSLSDGLYTAEAAEVVAGTASDSGPVEFVVKVNPPALTLISPLRGGSSGARPLFYGLAGHGVGDFPVISVTLYAGSTATGHVLGVLTAQSSGAGWIIQNPTSLALGLYTVVARQSDIAGHTSVTPAHTFLVVPGSTSIIGASVSVTQNGLGSVPVLCPGRVNTLCRGTITVSTARAVRPAGGGAKRTLTLFRARFTAYGATTLVVRGELQPEAERTLRTLGRVAVNVTLSLSVAGGTAHRYTGARRASIAR